MGGHTANAGKRMDTAVSQVIVSVLDRERSRVGASVDSGCLACPGPLPLLLLVTKLLFSIGKPPSPPLLPNGL